MKIRFGKFLLITFLAMFGSAAAHAQCTNYRSLSPRGDVADCVSGGVQGGQILSLNSSNQVVPISAGATGGAFAIAIQAAGVGGTVPVLIGNGNVPISVDNACAVGNYVQISSTNAGNGHCVASIGSVMVVGVATGASSTASAVPVQLSSLTSVSGASGGGGTPTGGISGQNLVAQFGTNSAFASAGIAGRSVSGTTDTIGCDSSSAVVDRGTIITYTSGSGAAIAVPHAGATGCGNNFTFAVAIGSEAVGNFVFTPTTSTIRLLNGNGGATAATSLTLTTGNFCVFNSPDNSTYEVRCNQGGGIPSGTQGNPLIYSSGTSVGPSNQIVDASAFSGANGGAKVNAAVSALGASGGTIVVPDSLTSGGVWSTVNLGSSSSFVNLKFTGSGNFTTCTVNAAAYSDIDLGKATLTLSGTSCIGINQANFITMQVLGKFILRGGTINCNGQISATGIAVGITGGASTSNTEIDSTTVTGCTDTTGSTYANPVGAGLITNTQFSHYRNLNLWGNYVNLKLYGGSSNTFYDLKSTAINGFSGVGVIANSVPAGAQGNIFINPQFQNGSITAMAVQGTSLEIDGGSPEHNNSGAASVTIDGFTIPLSGALYLSGSTVRWNNPSTEDAAASPEIQIANTSEFIAENWQGFYDTGNLCQADSTSSCAFIGSMSSSSTVQNVASWPSYVFSPNSVVNNALNMFGAPLLIQNPNFPNAYTGNPMAPAATSCFTCTASTAADTVYGTVTTVAYAASIGTQCSANCVLFQNLIGSTLGATNDIYLSFLIKASAATSLKIYAGGSHFAGIASFPATTDWTRVVIFVPYQAANTNFNLEITTLDAVGATVSLTGFEALTHLVGSASQQLISTAISHGYVGTNGSEIFFGYNFQFKNPGCPSGLCLFVDNNGNLTGYGSVQTPGYIQTNGTAGILSKVYSFTNSGNKVIFSGTAPTITSGFNTSGFSVSANNGTAAFLIAVGTGTGTSTGVIGLPAANAGWTCYATNQTRAAHIQQTASTASSATLTNYGTTFAATNWTNSDVIQVHCSGY